MSAGVQVYDVHPERFGSFRISSSSGQPMRTRRCGHGGSRSRTDTGPLSWRSPARPCRPSIARSTPSAEGLTRGAYVLNARAEASGRPDIVLIATGSEVQLIVGAEPILAAKGVKCDWC